ncbi:hypothetical protein H9L39_06984 [Fusarium oxysporum f. sp. albedinis]|nr:hypothetical protein H9L39_06984 [Fusarium oxysporum f. sp. albedinis]
MRWISRRVNSGHWTLGGNGRSSLSRKRKEGRQNRDLKKLREAQTNGQGRDMISETNDVVPKCLDEGEDDDR